MSALVTPDMFFLPSWVDDWRSGGEIFLSQSELRIEKREKTHNPALISFMSVTSPPLPGIIFPSQIHIILLVFVSFVCC